MRTALSAVLRAACGASSAVQCWATSSTAASVPARRMAAVALMRRALPRCYAFAALSGPKLELSLASVLCKTLETALENTRAPFSFPACSPGLSVPQEDCWHESARQIPAGGGLSRVRLCVV